MTDIAGIVLCGGRSGRMGVDKHSLPFGQRTMLECVLDTLREVTEHQFVVAASDQDVEYALASGAHLVRDSLPDLGPVEGIASGLSAAEKCASLAFVAGCDVPLLVPEFVTHMAALCGDSEIVTIDDGDVRHPLCAVYRTNVHEMARALLSNGQRAAQSLLDACHTRSVSPDEFTDVDPQLHSLKNVNTQAEYRAALRLAGQTG